MDNSNTTLIAQKRLFIGIKISPSKNLSNYIGCTKSDLKEFQINWAPTENYHITIRFLGNTSIYSLNAIKLIISNVVKRHNAFSIELESLGIFGKSKPKILWIGISESQTLKNIYNEINTSIETLGFSPTQTFNPHLTLGRIKEVGNIEILDKIITKANGKFFQKSEVSEISIFESILSNRGPKYSILHSEKLL